MREVKTMAQGDKFIEFAKRINRSDSVRRVVDMALMSDAKGAAKFLNCNTLVRKLGVKFDIYKTYKGGYKISAGDANGYICFSVKF